MSITAEQILSDPSFEVDKFISHINMCIATPKIIRLLNSSAEVLLSSILNNHHAYLQYNSNTIKPELFYEINEKYGHQLFIKSVVRNHTTTNSYLLIVNQDGYNNNYRVLLSEKKRSYGSTVKISITTLDKNKKIKIPYNYDEYGKTPKIRTKRKISNIVPLREILQTHFYDSFNGMHAYPNRAAWWYLYKHGTPNTPYFDITVGTDRVKYMQNKFYFYLKKYDKNSIIVGEELSTLSNNYKLFPLSMHANNINAIIKYIIDMPHNATLLSSLNVKISQYK